MKPSIGSSVAVKPPRDDQMQELLRRYVTAWESANVRGLIALLREDARFAMPPSPGWYSGREAIAAFARRAVFATGPGYWRMRPARANGQPALAVYGVEGSAPPRAVGIQVLTVVGTRIAEATTFMNPMLFRPFGLPEMLDALL